MSPRRVRHHWFDVALATLSRSADVAATGIIARAAGTLNFRFGSAKRFAGSSPQLPAATRSIS